MLEKRADVIDPEEENIHKEITRKSPSVRKRIFLRIKLNQCVIAPFFFLQAIFLIFVDLFKMYRKNSNRSEQQMEISIQSTIIYCK